MVKKAIEICNLEYHYPDGTLALEEIELMVDQGETIALVGPNGAGKSTLILHLNGIIRGNGVVRIMGREIDGKDVSWARERVGIVFQEPEDQLFMPTVFDDVAFGPLNMRLNRDAVQDRVRHALSQVELFGFSDRSAHHLSLGEKKKVAIATVLATLPEILVVDEPSSNLDPRSRRHLIELLKNFTHTKIIATHDMNLAYELCERTIVMDEGKIVADGPSATILRDTVLLQKHGLESPTIISS